MTLDPLPLKALIEAIERCGNLINHTDGRTGFGEAGGERRPDAAAADDDDMHSLSVPAGIPDRKSVV